MSRVGSLLYLPCQTPANRSFRPTRLGNALSFVVVGLLVLSLGACGGPENPPASTPDSTPPPPGGASGVDALGATYGCH